MNEFNNMGPQYNSSGSYIPYPQPPNTGFGPRSPMQMPTAQKGITTVTTILRPITPIRQEPSSSISRRMLFRRILFRILIAATTVITTVDAVALKYRRCYYG